MAKKDKKVKRKPRTKEIKKHDLLFPVNVFELGGENDPCFGKHQDLKEEACMSCGDSELCQIVMAQNNNILRAKVEKKGKFKDLEEKEIYDAHNATSKEIKAAIRKEIRTAGKIGQDSLIKNFIAPKFNLPNKKVEKMISSMLKKTNKFKLTKNNLVWNK